MRASEFLPLHAIRGAGIAWFLGAGTSAAAGIPTAYNLTWDFKRTLYCAHHKVSIKQVEDLGDPETRLRIQRFFDSQGGYPKADAIDEYAHYFETVYPAEADRRRYLDEYIASASPSIGHRALAALVGAGKTKVIWTTNFDRNIEDALVSILGGTARVIVATLDNPGLSIEALNEGRWPIVGKLHGDFQSRRLKNTSSELRAQDVKLREALMESCRRFGLAVVGYSGRDESVMDALEQAIAQGKGFPNGLFWFYRSGSPCLPRVVGLISDAEAAGIDAHLVESETFDELLADLTLLQADIPTELADSLASNRSHVSDAPIPAVCESPETLGQFWRKSPETLGQVIARIIGPPEGRQSHHLRLKRRRDGISGGASSGDWRGHPALASGRESASDRSWRGALPDHSGQVSAPSASRGDRASGAAA